MVSLTDHLVQLLLCHLLAKGLHYVAELIHRDVAIVILVEDSERGQRSICYLLRQIHKRKHRRIVLVRCIQQRHLVDMTLVEPKIRW